MHLAEEARHDSVTLHNREALQGGSSGQAVIVQRGGQGIEMAVGGIDVSIETYTVTIYVIRWSRIFLFIGGVW